LLSSLLRWRVSILALAPPAIVYMFYKQARPMPRP
jgi:hypothetical protein